MIRLDNQAGSRDLEQPLRSAGLVPEVVRLPSGDLEIIGQGPGGRPMLVGIEYKKLPDLLQCERDGRFAEQLRAMKKYYEISWLVIEGEWRVTAPAAVSSSRAATLEVRERKGWVEARGSYTYQEVVAWVLTMAQRGGVMVWRSRDQAETVEWLRTMYWWWTAKKFEEHKAHLQWYTPPWAPETPFDTAPSVERKVAAALLAQGPTVDINSERAKAVAVHFGSVRAMLLATEKEWCAVPGIGAKIAKRVVEVTQR